jgi:hypothetical protein
MRKDRQIEMRPQLSSGRGERDKFFVYMGNSSALGTVPFGPAGIRGGAASGPGNQYGGRRSIQEVCGYATNLTFNDYLSAYDRQDIATRIVETYPDYTWIQEPHVFENEKGRDTKFEASWNSHLKETKPLVHLRRLDILSGIGRFGILVIGVNDGKKIDTPLTPATYGSKVQRKVVYMRPYSEGEVEIEKWDTDSSSPRFGLPVLYKVTPSEAGSIPNLAINSFYVHYTRTIHFCDGAINSSVFGVSRLRRVYDRLTDIMKIVAGSAEMFWKGAYSGWSFVMDADAELTTERQTEMKKNIEAFMQGLDRHLLLQGVNPQSHAPNVSSPKDHLDVQLTMIAIASRIPKRIFAGSEMGKMASTQDAENWAKQVAQRRMNTAIPFLVRPYVDFCILNGIIRSPLASSEYFVTWPDLEAPTEKDQSETALNYTNALVAYTSNSLYKVMPLETYLVTVWNVPVAKAAALAENFDPKQFEKDKKEEAMAGKESGLLAKTARDSLKGGADKKQSSLAQKRRGGDSE